MYTASVTDAILAKRPHGKLRLEDNIPMYRME
jgi:hypothetical protein